MNAPPLKGAQPDLVGKTCQAIICQSFRYQGKILSDANVVFLNSSGVWHELVIDGGVIFWRTRSTPPQAWSISEDYDYPHQDIGADFALTDRIINAIKSHHIDGVMEVRISFQDGGAFVLHNEDDISSFRIEP